MPQPIQTIDTKLKHNKRGPYLRFAALETIRAFVQDARDNDRDNLTDSMTGILLQPPEFLMPGHPEAPVAAIFEGETIREAADFMLETRREDPSMVMSDDETPPLLNALFYLHSVVAMKEGYLLPNEKGKVKLRDTLVGHYKGVIVWPDYSYATWWCNANGHVPLCLASAGIAEAQFGKVSSPVLKSDALAATRDSTNLETEDDEIANLMRFMAIVKAQDNELDAL